METAFLDERCRDQESPPEQRCDHEEPQASVPEFASFDEWMKEGRKPIADREAREPVTVEARLATDVDEAQAYPMSKVSARTESQFAAWVARRNENRLRFVRQWDKFAVYDGKRWCPDGGPLVDQIIRAEASECWPHITVSQDLQLSEARECLGFLRRLNSAAGVGAIRSLLPSDAGILVDAEEFDQDALYLNIENGVLDLVSGKLRPHSPDLLLTKIAPVSFDPKAACPTWDRFLKEVFVEDELVEHVQRLAGYLLTGSVEEQKLFIFWGTGANGKSTFVEVLLALLGEYGMSAPPDLLMQKGDSHPTEMATLYGHRLAVCAETEEGRKLAEARVKMLTGGDLVTARRMREDFWQFKPAHKLVLCTNHKPEFCGTDYGLRRRLHLIPFLQTFPPEKQDKELPKKLRAELSGILNWALEGVRLWKRDGLQTPGSVEAATQEYVSSQDVLGAFLEECCRFKSSEKVRLSQLYSAYQAWCDSRGELPMSTKRFSPAIAERGATRRKSDVIWFDGIGLVTSAGPTGE